MKIQTLIERDGGQCFYCKTKVYSGHTKRPKGARVATRDHFHPKSQGGRDIVLACAPCNLKKADMSPAQFIVELYFGHGTPYENTTRARQRREVRRQKKIRQRERMNAKMMGVDSGQEAM